MEVFFFGKVVEGSVGEQLHHDLSQLLCHLLVDPVLRLQDLQQTALLEREHQSRIRIVKAALHVLR